MLRVNFSARPISICIWEMMPSIKMQKKNLGCPCFLSSNCLHTETVPLLSPWMKSMKAMENSPRIQLPTAIA